MRSDGASNAQDLGSMRGPTDPFPIRTVGVVLVENVVSTVPKERSIDIIHPSPRRGEMVRGSMGILLKLFSQFLCTFDELFGLFNFVGHYAFTPFLWHAVLRSLQAVTSSAIRMLHVGVHRVVPAGEGYIDRECRGIGCN